MLVEVNGTTDLTGSTPEEGVFAFRLQHSRNQEIIDLIDSDFIKTQDFENERFTITFSVSRVHASEGDASLYCFTHPLAVPGSGTVAFTCQDGQGNTIGTKTLNDAIILVTGMEWESHSTTAHYQMTGGSIT